MRRLTLLIAVVLMVAGVADSLAAAEQVEGTKVAQKPNYRVALVPVIVDGGRGTAEEKMPETYRTVFANQGYDLIMGKPVVDVMRKLDIRVGDALPTNKELLKIGMAMSVDYVVAAHFKVRTRRVWVMAMPKAKSSILVDTRIVDVRKAEVVFDPKGGVGFAQTPGSATESQGGSDLQTGVGLVVSYPVALFMGGTPREEERKAAEKCVKTTYEAFFNRNTQTKIRLDEE